MGAAVARCGARPAQAGVGERDYRSRVLWRFPQHRADLEPGADSPPSSAVKQATRESGSGVHGVPRAARRGLHE